MCDMTTCVSTGHEDATEDFGIYEFVSIPGKMESTQVFTMQESQLVFYCWTAKFEFSFVSISQASCRSLARLESVQDMHTTIYDVIRHVPEMQSHSLLK